MNCELCELSILPDQMPGSPLMPHSLRPIANSAAACQSDQRSGDRSRKAIVAMWSMPAGFFRARSHASRSRGQRRFDLRADFRVGLGLAAALERRARACATELSERPGRMRAHQRLGFIARATAPAPPPRRGCRCCPAPPRRCATIRAAWCARRRSWPKRRRKPSSSSAIKLGQEWHQRVVGRRARADVPRAYLLADVAAENPVAEFGSQSDGIGPRCSIVRYEMHTRGSRT